MANSGTSMIMPTDGCDAGNAVLRNARKQPDVLGHSKGSPVVVSESSLPTGKGCRY